MRRTIPVTARYRAPVRQLAVLAPLAELEMPRARDHDEKDMLTRNPPQPQTPVPRRS